ncbi:(2Fe-2S)-binding protein [Nocardia bovistercoris]|uniref:(2Fe-2S)-binding protein n=1 Tax=Nocardia bovistercoris TaxID=2785916 RepID=A0A931MZN6_9NOCA|nr:(2Fe-2S)-binding protein [Nocardia bovistercoris]MBH0776345.1 (2Fe-2S)-binding protein [Nocardia bovistercoris]
MNHITLRVNGTTHRVGVAEDTLLLDALRDDVGVTSAREGCGVGVCGACTVLCGGRSVSACLAVATRYDDTDITTADGLDENDPVVSSFVDSNAMQCGYCIPGFVMMTKELLSENPAPSDDEITAHLEGNICRCATYPEILEAVRLAATRSNT